MSTRTPCVSRTVASVATAGLLAATLALTACTADPEVDDGQTMNALSNVGIDLPTLVKTEGLYLPAEGALTVFLGDALSEAMPDGAASVVQSYAIAVEPVEPGMCRTDLTITYNEGGREAMAEWAESPDGAAAGVTIRDSAPADDELEPGGEYYSEDFGIRTIVSDCSEEDFGDDEAAVVAFPEMTSLSNGGKAELGRFHLFVRADGAIQITDPEIGEFDNQDAEWNWVWDDESWAEELRRIEGQG